MEDIRLTERDWKDVVSGLTLAMNHQKPTKNFKEILFDLRFFIEQKLKISSKPLLNSSSKKDCYNTQCPYGQQTDDNKCFTNQVNDCYDYKRSPS